MLTRTLTIDLSDRDLRESCVDTISLIYRELPYDVSEELTSELTATIASFYRWSDRQVEEYNAAIIKVWADRAAQYGMTCSLDTEKHEYVITMNLANPFAG